MEKYDDLREQYPEYVSLDELCRICKIAKRSASYLVTNGIIPAVDTGKKTWRYKIALDDVITYLRQREQVGSMIPPGEVTSRKNVKRRKTSQRRTFAQTVVPGREWEIAEYFDYIFGDCDDVLSTADVVEMIGLDKSTVLKLLKAGHIKSVMTTPKYIIPKQYLMDFVVTRKFIEYRTDSEHFIKILGGFELWKKAKSTM